MKPEETRELHTKQVVRPDYIRLAGAGALALLALIVTIFFLGRESSRPARQEVADESSGYAEEARPLLERLRQEMAVLEARSEETPEPKLEAEPVVVEANPFDKEQERRLEEILRAVGASPLSGGRRERGGAAGSPSGLEERLERSRALVEQQVTSLQERLRDASLLGGGGAEALKPIGISAPTDQLEGAWVAEGRRRGSGDERLVAGTAIRAALVTAVNTDRGGTVIAQITRDVRDRVFERIVLPAGSRLLAHLEESVAAGDQRIALAWRRLEMPDGVYFELPGMASADLQGAAGVKARVNNHYGAIYGRAILLSLIGAGLQLSQPERRDDVRLASGEIAAGAVGTELGRVSTELLRRSAERRPTLRVKPGTEILILLNRDLVLGGER